MNASVLRVAALCAVLGISAVALTAFTAANTVPATHVGRQQFPINANALKPAACSALNLTTVVSTPASGTTGNDLILGSGTASTLTGGGGQDCMVGGAGADTFNGNGKNAGDVCIGAGGTDVNQANKCQNFTQ